MKSMQQALNATTDDLLKRAAAYAAKAKAAPPPVPQCPVCEDMGCVQADVPYGHPDFGKLLLCPNEKCAKRRETIASQWEKKLAKSGLPRAYCDLTFETWDAAVRGDYLSGKRLARAAAELFVACDGRYVSLIEANRYAGRELGGADIYRNSLVLQGAVGVGKTGLAAAIANALLAGFGIQPLYIRVQDFIAHVQSTYSRQDDSTTADHILNMAKRADVLILDEFNMPQATANRQEIMEAVIRYRHGHSLPTVVTCNATPDEFEAQWGRRTSDVLLNMAHWIPMGGLALRDTRQLIEPEAF